MPELSPKTAAELAEEIYAVNRSQLEMEIFLSRPEFSGKSGAKHELKAELGFRLINTRDAFGICAKGGKGFENDIFIIFRGSTKLKADWMTNARLGVQTSGSGWPVHIGFNTAFKSMLPQIQEFLRGSGKNATIHCIGHSLGGAVASIAANWIAHNKPQKVKLYTFGAPKPGLMLFANSLTRKIGKSNIFRTYHATDPVPMVPLFPFVQPPLPGFGHCIPSSEGILGAAAHDMKKYVKSVSGQSWANLERRKPPYSIESSVKLWLQSKTPVNAGSPKIWPWINSSLIYVLTKVVGVTAGVFQAGLMGAMTLADTIAWILRKGIELGDKSGLTGASKWVLLLMNKIMQALGMGVPDETTKLTQNFIRNILIK
ncbi:MAG: lipase family protein, partial [Gammaproteobacteria bacterium]|nr:lipase family protein [Gammaproteobacteria bacterium]